jgi:hypothetical protein
VSLLMIVVMMTMIMILGATDNFNDEVVNDDNERLITMMIT